MRCLLGPLQASPCGPAGSVLLASHKLRIQLLRRLVSVATRATEIFAQHLAWIESQFRALGKGKDSNGLAVHLLSAMQGVSILAHSFHDSDLVAMETKRLKSWIQSL